MSTSTFCKRFPALKGASSSGTVAQAVRQSLFLWDDLKCPPLSGCGTQHPHRALGGTCVLLAAAPTATLCFRRWRRSLLLQAIPSPALLPCGQQGPTPADGPQRNCQPFCGFHFYFLIFCKCFMPSSKRLRKASTSSGVLSAQKDTRMAVSMASGSRPMAASVWLGWPRPQALAEET